jgi:hypothetical protein
MANTVDAERLPGTSEEQPLLGERGDASLPEGRALYHNFILGPSPNQADWPVFGRRKEHG